MGAERVGPDYLRLLQTLTAYRKQAQRYTTHDLPYTHHLILTTYYLPVGHYSPITTHYLSEVGAERVRPGADLALAAQRREDREEYGLRLVDSGDQLGEGRGLGELGLGLGLGLGLAKRCVEDCIEGWSKVGRV